MKIKKLGQYALLIYCAGVSACHTHSSDSHKTRVTETYDGRCTFLGDVSVTSKSKKSAMSELTASASALGADTLVYGEGFKEYREIRLAEYQHRVLEAEEKARREQENRNSTDFTINHYVYTGSFVREVPEGHTSFQGSAFQCIASET